MKLFLILEPVGIVTFVFFPLNFIGLGSGSNITRKRVQGGDRRIFRFADPFVQDKKRIVLDTFPSDDETGLIQDLCIKKLALRFRKRGLKRISETLQASFFK